MREQDKRKFQDPDNPEPSYEYVVYVWRKKWRKVADVERFTKLTPAFLRRLRKKYRKQIADDEVMRVVEKRAAEFFGGAGNPPKFFKPLTPKQRAAAKKEARRIARQQKKLAAARTRKRIPYSTRWGRCERCTHRALWLVGFAHKKTHKHVVKKCCTKHAWRDTDWMPALHPEQIVCVQRRRNAA